MAKGGKYAGNMPDGAQRIPGYPAPPNDGKAYQAKLDANREIKDILAHFEGVKQEQLEAAVAKMRRDTPDPRDVLIDLKKACNYFIYKK